MRSSRSLTWRLSVGFAGAGLIALALAAAGMLALQTVAHSLAALTSNEMEHLVLAERIRRASEQKVAATRGYLLTGDEAYLARMEEQRQRFRVLISWLREVGGVGSVEAGDLLSRAERTERQHQSAFDRAKKMLEGGATRQQISVVFEREVQAEHARLDRSLEQFSGLAENRYKTARRQASDEAKRAAAGIVFLTGLGILLLVALTVLVVAQTVRLFRREQAATESAERAVAAREQILAVVSHDLNNPLSSILMKAALLERSTPDDASGDRVRRATSSIRHAANRMQYLIRNLLDAASLEAGRLVLELKPCRLDDLFAETVDLFDAAAAQKSVDLRCHLPGETLAVLADRERILQVLSNLVGNAIKFTPKGGAVSLRASATPDEVTFAVEDTGPGIPEEYRARVFERFWTTKQEGGKGTGLGLFIAQRIVEAHGRRIWIESWMGRGTVVSFTLRRTDPVQRRDDRARDDGARATSPEPGSHLQA
jgi:signal transduction histidine kinase